jgi:hypothetical protein
MKKFNKIFAVVLAIAFVLSFSFSGPSAALAATTPSLGQATTFGILSSTYTNTVAGTTINGDLGYTTPPAVTPTVNGVTHPADATYAQAGIDQNAALAALNSQPCTFTFPAGAVDLATETTHGPIGIYTPGVYCTTVASAASIGTAGITLSGAGTFIFRINGALTTVANSNVTLANGASSCNVFWTPTGATTLAANTTFAGTDIDAAGITVGNATTLTGRALAFGGTVSTTADTINSACSSGIAAGAGGGPLLVSAPLVPPLINITKIPTPLALPAGPGLVTYDYLVTNVGVVPMNNVTVTDNSCTPVNFISGDTNNNALLDLTETWHYSCTTTLAQTTVNTALATGHANGFTTVDTANATVVVGALIVPPLIHLTKIPNLFVIPFNTPVTYTYTVTNPGTVPLSNVTLVDNRCSPISGHFGDLNGNNLLDVSEVWTYTCTINLTANTTNTATVQGSANGLTATDVAFATVVVTPSPGLPITGYGPDDNNNLWSSIIPVGILLFALGSFFVIKRRTV